MNMYRNLTISSHFFLFNGALKYGGKNMEILALKNSFNYTHEMVANNIEF